LEIQNNHLRESTLKKVINKLGKKRIYVISILLVALLGFGFSCIVWGAYLQKTKQTGILKMFLIRISEFDFSFIPKHIEGRITNIENFFIDVKFENWEKIRYYREKALANGLITSEMKQWVPANIRYNNHTYNVDISITGVTTNHLIQPSKWSLSVKVKDQKTIMGLRKFALLIPWTRGYLTDWIATEILKSQSVIGLRSNFVNVSINGKDGGLYYLEERFDKRLIENNQLSEGIMFKLTDNGLDVYGLKKIIKNEELSSQLIKLKRMIHGFLTGEICAERIFDLKKLATLYVVTDILNAKHAGLKNNMRFYFNPITSLIEPIGREWEYLRRETYFQKSLSIEKPNHADWAHLVLGKDLVLNKIFNSFAFQEEYIKQASILSNPEYLDSLFNIKKNVIEDLLNKIYKENPFYEFPIDLLHKNQERIKKKIYPTLQYINVYYNHTNADSVFLSVENKIELPVEIHYFKYNSKTEIFPADRILLKSNYKTTTTNQNISFRLSNHIRPYDFSSDSLEVYYSVLGNNEIKKAVVYPVEMTENDFSNINPTRRPSNINEFPFLIVNKDAKMIEFPDETCAIQKDLIIPVGYTVSAKPGCIINLTNSAKIISYSPIVFFGKSNNLIHITSSDSTGQGIVVFSCERVSELSYVIFENLSNISDFGWNLRGAITFYESQVNINNCVFSKNLRGDDYLNIVRTNFNILNTTFTNTNADAFDSDFCRGTIENVKFLHAGNDAIDISGTNVKIENVYMDNIGDKGISAGENSQVVANNVIVENSQIAICSKDKSKIKISNTSIKNSQIAFTAYQKKSEFGSGFIEGFKVKIENVPLPYLIETNSICTIDGEIQSSNNERVKDDLYGVKYGKGGK
jgi:hypothetical protein